MKYLKKNNINENKIIKFNPEQAEIKDYLKKLKILEIFMKININLKNVLF